MQVSGVLLVLYLTHGHQVSADVTSFIGGRATCGAFNRAVTSATVVSSNCYRLTNANANLACSRYSNRPTVVNYGTSSFFANCNDPLLIMNGPKFAPFSTAIFFPDLQLVSSDTSAALGGLINYLSYDTVTGFVQESGTPQYDVNQVYSFVLINKLTGATSDPVYFNARLFGCSLILAGPSTLTVCTGPGIPQPLGAPTLSSTVMGNNVAVISVCNPGVANVDYDAANGNCPAVPSSSNGDITPCYISTGGVFPTTSYQIGKTPIPFVKFTQILTISADAVPKAGFATGSKNIAVTFDPTCNAPTATPTC